MTTVTKKQVIKEEEKKSEKKPAPWRQFEKDIFEDLQQLDDWNLGDHKKGTYRIKENSAKKEKSEDMSHLKLEKEVKVKVLIPDFRLSHTRASVFILDAKYYFHSQITIAQIKQVGQYESLTKSSGSALIILPKTRVAQTAIALAKICRVRIFRYDENFVVKVQDWLSSRLLEHENQTEKAGLHQEINRLKEYIFKNKDRVESAIKGWISKYASEIKRMEMRINEIMKVIKSMENEEWDINLAEINDQEEI